MVSLRKRTLQMLVVVTVGALTLSSMPRPIRPRRRQRRAGISAAWSRPSSGGFAISRRARVAKPGDS
jgi:hypothetical protein